MRIAFDIHGVIDAMRLGPLAMSLTRAGHEVYILTGMHWLDGAEEYLKHHGFYLGENYKKFLSVADYHKELGTSIRYDERNRPWLDSETWNCTKAQICFDYKIDVLIDDSAVYAGYFDSDHLTQYLLFNIDTVKDDIREIVSAHETDGPYIIVKRTFYQHKYNPNYKGEQECECGHPYERHFDSYEAMEAVGCKYCNCGTFRPKVNNDKML